MAAKQELFDFSHFDHNAILRGAQLTLVGAQRALQNPDLWTTQHYRQAVLAVASGIAIRLLIEIPIFFVRILIWLLSWFVHLDTITWDDTLIDSLRFLQNYVLQVPLFLMSLMRHITPAMDDLFMQALQWVDHTYVQKHEREGPIDPQRRYYENLRLYADQGKKLAAVTKPAQPTTPQPWTRRLLSGGVQRFLLRFARRTGLSLAVYALSFLPVIGRFVLPAASFYTFRGTAGLGPAALVFGAGLLLPRRYIVVFLQTYYGQRSLMRELLGPYLSRVRFSSAQRRHWFSSREGILFGFGAGFYVLLRVPLVGVLIYGIAEASTAYLITKITDPPPAAAVMASASAEESMAMRESFAANQEQWRNKRAFLELALDNLDALQKPRPVYTRQESGPATATVTATGSATLAAGAAIRREKGEL